MMDTYLWLLVWKSEYFNATCLVRKDIFLLYIIYLLLNYSHRQKVSKQ